MTRLTFCSLNINLSFSNLINRMLCRRRVSLSKSAMYSVDSTMWWLQSVWRQFRWTWVMSYGMGEQHRWSSVVFTYTKLLLSKNRKISRLEDNNNGFHRQLGFAFVCDFMPHYIALSQRQSVSWTRRTAKSTSNNKPIIR